MLYRRGREAHTETNRESPSYGHTWELCKRNVWKTGHRMSSRFCDTLDLLTHIHKM